MAPEDLTPISTPALPDEYAYEHTRRKDTERSLPTLIMGRIRAAAPRLPWYGLAVGLSVLALVLMLLFRPLMEHSVFFLFLAAVAVSAIYGGLGPGLMATTLSALASNYFFLRPYGELFSGPEGALRLTIFLATGLIISWLADGRKRAEEHLRQRNEDLEREAAQRKALEKRLAYRATHDYLTDLHNQASFYEHLSRALSLARRRASKVAVMFVDLDDFKLVNDSLDHQEGDRVLRAVAERLRESLRGSDLAARIGGDEFAVLLEDVTDASRAHKVAERFQERLRVPFEAGEEGHMMYTSASIGIAVGAEEGPQELLRAADEASYQAKRTGKARSVIFAPGATRGGTP
jgi:diguanylate cyclase (GGDEF)-like protein